jgi:Flp pilus assembly protein TadG
MSRVTRLERTASRGQAMVEFAMVVPIFILLLVGIVDGGRMIFTNNHLAEAAREGARWGSVQGRSATSSGRDAIAAETASRISGVQDFDVTVTCERGGASVSNCASGDILTVTVEADVQLVTPILSQLLGDQTLSSVSKVMVNQ